jgi:glucose-1-phosphate cytidylyltransferase
MKVVILNGGLGTRLSGETETKPKGMVDIGGKPILWHIMMHYTHYGFHDFVIALGYKAEVTKRYMIDYATTEGDLTVDVAEGKVETHYNNRPPWRVELIDTGMDTQTGGRIKRIAPYVNDETFMLTWNDGVSNVDLNKLLEFHRSHGKLATLTAVHPISRFGHLDMEGDAVTHFSEKLHSREGWVNGAFFVLEPGVFDYIDGDETSWELISLVRLAEAGQLMAYRHDGFWRCMDTPHDLRTLREIWDSGNAPWKTW